MTKDGVVHSILDLQSRDLGSISTNFSVLIISNLLYFYLNHFLQDLFYYKAVRLLLFELETKYLEYF